MSISSTRTYSIVEPHPSASAGHYFTTGRGGAGNRVRVPEGVTQGSEATGPAARVPLVQPLTARKTFTSGRGGAGNVHPTSERAIFSFDEELQLQLSHERRAAPVYHVGRGGAGNTSIVSPSSTSSVFDSQRRRSSDSRGSFTSTGSASSGESNADVVNRNLKKGLKKILGH